MSDEEETDSEDEDEDERRGKLSSVTTFFSGVISGFVRSCLRFRGVEGIATIIMLNVPSSSQQSFPAPGSQQRVAPAGQAGRNKVSLKPGHSLMDWIRFAKSGRDLTGLRGRLIDVTEDELKKHNTRNDCWTCIRGMVYNVSPYMDYHPGGEEELMRAAGIDGTDLFDQVHRWVNYESMLKECLVGRMAVKTSSAMKAPAPKKGGGTNMNGLAPPPPPAPPAGPATLSPSSSSSFSSSSSSSSSMLQPPSAVPAPAKDTRPRYDWFQTDVAVNVVIYTKRKIPGSGCTIVDLDDGGSVLRVEVLLGKMSYMLHLRLAEEVEDSVAVHTAPAVGKIQVSVRKRAKGKWTDLGQTLELHNTILRQKDRELHYRECRLVSKTEVNHNTHMFQLQLPRGTAMHVPVGKHVYLKALIHDSVVVKPYTPVEERLIPAASPDSASPDSASPDSDSHLFLMIKVYPDGVFSPHLNSLNIGDHVSVSGPEGPFSLRPLREVTHLYLLAAGTGFTPMARLIRLTLQDLNTVRQIKMMFFNRHERDILWRSELDELAANDERFQVEYVLSEPCDAWTGQTGRPDQDMLARFLHRPHHDDAMKCYVCVCGPTAFNELTEGLVKQQGFGVEEIHAFQG